MLTLMVFLIVSTPYAALAAVSFGNSPEIDVSNDRFTVTFTVHVDTQAEANDTTPYTLSVQKLGQAKTPVGHTKTLQSDLEFPPAASSWPRTGTLGFAASGNIIQENTYYDWFVTRQDGTIIGQGHITTGTHTNTDGSNHVDINPGGSSTCTEGPGEYCLLEPLPIGTTGQQFDKIFTDDSFGKYVNVLIKIIIGIVGVLAVITIVLGGVQYMTTDAFSRKEGGKEMITRSILGLVIALGSVLLLNTINPQLSAIVFSIDSAVISIQPQFIENAEQATTTTNDIRACGGFTVNQAGHAWYNDATERTALQDGYKISVVGQNCSTFGQEAACTSVAKYTNTQITDFRNLSDTIRQSCPTCALNITGGTECWKHKTHDIAKPIFDAEDTVLVSYVITDANKQHRACIPGWPVQANQSRAQCVTSDSRTGAWGYSIGNWMFVDEGNHFHVCQGSCVH